MRYFYDARERTWSDDSGSSPPVTPTPLITIVVGDGVKPHELAAPLHRLAVELEEKVRQEIAAKDNVRANKMFGPDYGQNVEVAE